MARRRRKGRRGAWPTRLAAVAVVGALAAAAWFGWQWWSGRPAPARKVAVPAVPVPPAAADPVRPVALGGELRLLGPARDAELGVSAEAVALERRVEMLQWEERCSPAPCRYELRWSEQAIDSSGFREPEGHRNAPMPLASRRFLAGGIWLDGVEVEPQVALAQIAAMPWPVRLAELPANLAASFREHEGMLYAGADPAHPAPGDLRVSYRIVPGGAQRLTGFLADRRLQAKPQR